LPTNQFTINIISTQDAFLWLLSGGLEDSWWGSLKGERSSSVIQAIAGLKEAAYRLPAAPSRVTIRLALPSLLKALRDGYTPSPRRAAGAMSIVRQQLTGHTIFVEAIDKGEPGYTAALELLRTASSAGKLPMAIPGAGLATFSHRTTVKALDLLSAIEQRTAALTIGEIARMLAVSTETVRLMAAKQEIPSLKIGSSVEILNQLASNRSKAEALRNEIAHILNGLPRASPPDASAESTPGRESQRHCAVPGSDTPKAHDLSQKYLAPSGRALSAKRRPLWVSSSLMARYDREELYERVWTIPIRKLAKQYGVSDVALAKSCRKLSIRLPGRGYWAKKNANRPVSPRPPIVAIRTRKLNVAGEK
jgi:excisionase family DNA binding protein